VAAAATVAKGFVYCFALKERGGDRPARQDDDHAFHGSVVLTAVWKTAGLLELVGETLASSKLSRIEPALAAGDGVGHGIVVPPGDDGSGRDDGGVRLEGQIGDGNGRLGDSAHARGSGGRVGGGWSNRFRFTTGSQSQKQQDERWK
jgi:hypothetical protein